MESNLPSKDGNPNKTAIHSSNNGQSIPVRKAIPRIEKLRTESVPMSPLSLNGSLTTDDVCDTSFGKKVIEHMIISNAEIPDESFSEEVLQDMDYSLDALRDAVPVLCLKKNDDSCEDTDIFEEMSAYQVMGIFNNKDSQRRDQAGNRQNDKDSELKNKRNFPDKNIDVLYQNTGNKDNPNRNDELECTKHPGKKMDEGEDNVNNVIQDNEKDINNNDNECTMEIMDTSTNGCDLIQNKENVNQSEKDACYFNNSQGKETNKEICQKGESLGGEEGKKSLCENQNNMNVEVKDKIENSSKVNGKNTLIENEISNLCNKEELKKECKEELSQKKENKDCALHSNMAESKSFQKDATLRDEDKCTEKNVTVKDELHDKSEITNMNDSMRNISVDNDFETTIEEICETSIEPNCVPVSFSVKCSSCDFTSPKKLLLQQHQVFYHDKWLFQCCVCRSGYNTKGALERHKLAHWGCKMRKRKFKCDLCSKSYFFRLSLQKHLKYHKHKVQNIKPQQQRRPKLKKNAFIL